ncbi:TPA: hypothetical protein N0F65_007647 [Lagenidium giganteum]|uniref:AraC effector-binding domain-containing protein n=1 Tax=Lagenidium giganteum TaxID=4803 RepID=A0AAV2Z9A5_9STRA|nr:TPA: hypothetical protein N0F65_007647 [Lagenidium giganteum]
MSHQVLRALRPLAFSPLRVQFARAFATQAPPIEIKSTTDQRVFGLRTTIEDYTSCESLWKTAFAAIDKHQLSVAGPPFSIYYDPGFKPKDVDVEACVPITSGAKAPLDLDDNIRVCTLPGFKRAACVLHVGSFTNIRDTYNRLFEWIASEGHEVVGPVREFYLKGAVGLPPELTEIQVPIA